MSRCEGGGLKHLLAFEDDPDRDDQGRHQQEERQPGPPLVGEGEGDVHSVETGHQGGRHQQQRHEGEDLHDVVLVEVDDAQDRVLQVFETLEGEVGVVDQGGDILEDDGQVVPQFGILGAAFALEDVGDQPLFVHDVLADDHGVLLQLVDVQQEFFVDVLLLVDALAELGYILGDELDDIGVEVHALVHDFHEGGEAVGELLRQGQDLELQRIQGPEGDLADRRQDTAGQDEGDGIHQHLVVGRGEKVGVGEDDAVFFEETGGTFDLLRFGAALDLRAEECFDRPLLLSCRLQEVYPEDIFFADSSKLRFGLADKDV